MAYPGTIVAVSTGDVRGYAGRRVDYCQNGVLWAVVSSTANSETFSFYYSTDQGQTWTHSSASQITAGGSNNFLSPSPALFIDKADYAHLSYIQGNNISYRVGTPNAGRTQWTWSSPVVVDTNTNLAHAVTDVVAHAEGSNYMAHVFYITCDTAPNKYLYHHKVLSTGSGHTSPATSGTRTLIRNFGAITYPYFSADFRHTQADPKSVQSSTPSLYLAYGCDADSLRFRKATYSAGAWSWGAAVTLDVNSLPHTDQFVAVSAVYDGTNFNVAYSVPDVDNTKVYVITRNEADTTTTQKDPPALNDGRVYDLQCCYSPADGHLWVQAVGETSKSSKVINHDGTSWRTSWLTTYDAVDIGAWFYNSSPRALLGTSQGTAYGAGSNFLYDSFQVTPPSTVTPTYITSWEDGVDFNYVYEDWTNFGSSISTAQARTGSRSVLIPTSSAYIRRSLETTGDAFTLGFAFYYATSLPTNAQELVSVWSSAQFVAAYQLRFKTSTSRLEVFEQTGATVKFEVAKTLSANTWYLALFEVDTTSPNHGLQVTIANSDGSSPVSNSGTHAPGNASDMDEIHFGAYDIGSTVATHIDDVWISVANGDYELMKERRTWTVESKRVNADGTHTATSSIISKYNGQGDIVAGTTDAWSFIDEQSLYSGSWTNGQAWLGYGNASTSGLYAEALFADITHASYVPHAAYAITVLGRVTTGTDNSQVWMGHANNLTQVKSTSDLPSTGATFYRKMLPPPGNDWTRTTFNEIRFRFGWQDGSPDVYCGSPAINVLLSPAGSPPPVNTSAQASLAVPAIGPKRITYHGANSAVVPSAAVTSTIHQSNDFAVSQGGRLFDYCQNGNIFYVWRSSGSTISLFYSADGGATWNNEAGSGLTDGVSGSTWNRAIGFFIDKDDYAHIIYHGTTYAVTYRRGTPNAGRTGYTSWSAPLQVNTTGAGVTWGGLDVVAHREGTGWKAHLVWCENEPGSGNGWSRFATVNITSGGTITFTTYGIMVSHGVNTGAWHSIDFRHTLADPKTVQTSTPNVYVAISRGDDGGGFTWIAKFNYSGGTWSQHNGVGSYFPLDNTEWNNTNAAPSLYYDGTRCVIAYSDQGNGEVRIAERDEANTTTTLRTPPTVSSTAYAHAVGYDNDGNIWIVARHQDGDVRKVKYDRAGNSWGSWTTILASSNYSPHELSLSRGIQPAAAGFNQLGVVYVDYDPTPDNIKFHAMAKPTQCTVTPPASMQNGDLVLITAVTRSNSGTWSVGVTGGQGWAVVGGALGGYGTVVQRYRCKYNGTWTANPRFDNTSGEACVVTMTVFRSTGSGVTWTVSEESYIYGEDTSAPRQAIYNHAQSVAILPDSVQLVEWHNDVERATAALVAGSSLTAPALTAAASPTKEVAAGTDDGTTTSSNTTYATARLGSNLSLNGTAADLWVGQQYVNPTYYIFQPAFRFDTSSIPDGATITSATLYLFGSSDQSGQDFTLEARLHQSWTGAFSSAPYVPGGNVSADPLLASYATSGGWPTSYIALTSQAAFLTNINKTGHTYIYLSTDRIRTSTIRTDGVYEYVGVGSFESGSPPKLAIAYTYSVAGTIVGEGLTVALGYLITGPGVAGLSYATWDVSDEANLYFPATHAEVQASGFVTAVTPTTVAATDALPSGTKTAGARVTPNTVV